MSKWTGRYVVTEVFKRALREGEDESERVKIAGFSLHVFMLTYLWVCH